MMESVGPGLGMVTVKLEAEDDLSLPKLITATARLPLVEL
jgi:hypothetical protein